ncbi:hypothetical protein Psesu_2417 [Pseudoxanthomonas suwonensis 11-1]|uniref:Cellulose synthase n=1 Tax=Pseudoxanthomonas suwonensis (strain 11-1) TaxID=743721 RepID=E6WVQ0_PSEUU|nr:cellulose biosynthesis protein BcsD [Pseudoxanthomonas suwonensis]ADV28249.1 hypothetical protein Psesu_2417 [Pseudoxanthomonas suwonensis 11-1]
MTPDDLLDHYRTRSCAPQWRGFMRALCDELEHGLDEEDRARLMARLGERFAGDHPLPEVPTLDALQTAANAVWAPIEWGRAEFEEMEDRVLIRHFASPLAAAGGAGRPWLAAFLEGVYRAWFRAAGTASVLDVACTHADANHVDSFVLSRVS